MLTASRPLDRRPLGTPGWQASGWHCSSRLCSALSVEPVSGSKRRRIAVPVPDRRSWGRRGYGNWRNRRPSRSYCSRHTIRSRQPVSSPANHFPVEPMRVACRKLPSAKGRRLVGQALPAGYGLQHVGQAVPDAKRPARCASVRHSLTYHFAFRLQAPVARLPVARSDVSTENRVTQLRDVAQHGRDVKMGRCPQGLRGRNPRGQIEANYSANNRAGSIGI